ncbi:hypothetical protein D770_18285 [Flammeovirgaceae bacterium 311]|nr:hypothetical protein D770_18285 [Flammeovirgaceae bacterium 311]
MEKKFIIVENINKRPAADQELQPSGNNIKKCSRIILLSDYKLPAEQGLRIYCTWYKVFGGHANKATALLHWPLKLIPQRRTARYLIPHTP